jgi:threonyl-tRNA synthetase
LPYYKESMYPPMVMDDGTYYMKAMNCPHHHRIFQHQPRTYKELPLRLAEYGTCYRNELSGTLAGLLRVRALAMNDAHMYCRKDQIKDEFAGVLKLTMEYFDIFGLKDYWFRLSKWDPKHTEKYIDEPENWNYAEGVLREVLQEMKVPFVEVDDEAAFYGPKVDVQFKSVVGREETMSTIQLDFAAKKRFGLSYVDKDGQENNEVFVIHRAPLSVHERFMAFLIEHYAGAFPLWMAPIQVVVIPISQDQDKYGEKITRILNNTGFRAENWNESESMQNRIRKAEAQKVPYMLVVGKKEVANGTVAVRRRGMKNDGEWTIEKFVEKIGNEVEKKAIF